MPWVAIDGDDTGVKHKHALATNLKTYRLPTLVILNVKTGTFVTDQARKEVMETEGDVEKSKALIASWKERTPVPIGQASMGTSVMDSMLTSVEYFSKHPMVTAAIIAVLILTPAIERIKKNPLLGVAFLYMFQRLSKENAERNLPYIVQETIKEKSS
jgi:hypothetical protein